MIFTTDLKTSFAVADRTNSFSGLRICLTIIGRMTTVSFGSMYLRIAPSRIAALPDQLVVVTRLKPCLRNSSEERSMI